MTHPLFLRGRRHWRIFLSLLIAVTLFAAIPVQGADPVFFEGVLKNHQVETNHIRQGCPGSNYGYRKTTQPADDNTVEVPPDFSCPVMSFNNTLLTVDLPEQGVLGQIAGDTLSPPNITIFDNPAMQATLEGTARYSDDNPEVHNFRLGVVLTSAECPINSAVEKWKAPPKSSKNMRVQRACPITTLDVVQSSIKTRDGKVTEFEAEFTTNAQAEAAHAHLYPDPLWRGGLYEIRVKSRYVFTPVTDKVEIKTTTPAPGDEIAPKSMQGFEGEIQYTLLREEEGKLELVILRDNVLPILAKSDEIAVQRGTNTVTLSIPAFLLPEDGDLWLFARLKKANGDKLVDSRPVILEMTNDLIIDHVEVVQAVQHADNSVPLVAGKATMVRVFTKYKHKTNKMKKGVPVTLSVLRGGISPAGPPKLNSGAASYTRYPVERQYDNTSHNFYLPLEWTKEGDLTVVATVNPERTETELDYENNEGRAAVKFRTRRNFTVRHMNVCISLPGLVKQCPGGTVGAAMGYMRKIYPIAQNGLTYTPALVPAFEWTGWLNSWDAMGSLITRLNLMYMLHVATSPLQPIDQLIGWIPIGFTQNPSGGHTTGMSNPTWANGMGRVAFVADTSVWNDAYGNGVTLAHEIGHNLGLQHPPTPDSLAPSGYPLAAWPYPNATINEHGWDPIVRQIKRGMPAGDALTKYDFMTYVQPSTRKWISPHYYLKLFNGNFAPQNDPSGAYPASVPGTEIVPMSDRRRLLTNPREAAIISGRVSRDGTFASINPIQRMNSAADSSVNTPGGGYCLDLLDAAGSSLSSHCFDLEFRHVDTMALLDEASFSFLLDWPAGTAKVVLRKEGVEMRSVAASASAPTVEITAPAAGAQWQGGTQQTVTWTGTDADNDTLAYSLLYSHDGGGVWMPMAVDLAAAQYAFDPGTIQGGSQVQFRVLATDGFHTAQATSGAITVNQAPEITVEAPVDAGEVVAGFSRQVVVPVSNTGTGPLTVQSVTSDNPVFMVETPGPLVIPAGGLAEIEVLYAPEQEGASNGTLTFTSDAANDPGLAVAIEGTGTDGETPAIETAAGPIVFANVATGDSHAAVVAIRNASMVDLDVEWEFTGDGFTANSADPAFTLEELTGGGVTIGFSPEQPGDYAGELVITSNDPDDGEIRVAVTGQAYQAPPRPVINDGGVVDAAQGGPTVAAGGIASIYGLDLAPGIMVAGETPLPTELLGVMVFVDAMPAPIYFVAPNQINFQIPFEVKGRDRVGVVVVRDGVESVSASVSVADFAPAMFMNPAAGEPIVQRHSDGSLISSGNPAKRGEVLTLYLTGIGSLTSEPETGAPTPADPLPWATEMPVVTIGGVASQVHFCGLSPYFIGLAQINITVPADNLPSGAPLPLVIQFGEVESQAVSLPME